MKIGMSTNNFPTESIEQIIKNAKQFGIEYLELWAVNLETLGPLDNPYSYKNRNTEKVKELLQNSGVKVGVVASGIGLEKQFTRDRKEFVKELIHAVELAHEFGAGVVLHYGPGLLTDDTLNVDRLRLYWQDAADLAENYGIKLALENEPIDYTWKPENMLRLLEAFDSPAFMTNYDATNYYHSGAEAFPLGYDLLKDYIAYVHIKNGMAYDSRFNTEKCWIGTPMTHGYEGRTMYYTPADRGVINNTGLLARLHEDGYTGICTPEPQHTTHENACKMLEADVPYLRSTGYFN